MIVNTFEGEIDGKKFTDIKEFNEYLSEHKDAKNISLQSYTKTVNDMQCDDKQALEVLKTKQKTELTEDFYPAAIDPDKFLAERTIPQAWEDIKGVESKYAEYCEDHKRAIEKLDAKTLAEHKNELDELRITCKKEIKSNQQAIESINKKRDDLAKQLEEMYKERDRLDKSLGVLQVADQLFNERYNAIKRAIVDVEDLQFNSASHPQKPAGDDECKKACQKQKRAEDLSSSLYRLVNEIFKL